jgi:outer membrane receptor protein involved in Fe transport
VEVVAEAQDLRDVLSPGVVSIVRPDDVKGEHKALSDLLDQIPGVYVRRQSGSGHYTTASIRGSAPSQVNIYVDGVPMNLANEVAADISTLPISNVERVEVYRGVTPARFSGAPIGGAINIVTKKPSEPAGSISAGGRSLGGEQYAASLNFPLLGGHMLIGLDKDRSKGNFEYTDNVVKHLDDIVYGDGTTPREYQGASNLNIPARRERQSNSVNKENILLKWENKNFVFKYAQTDLDRYMPEGISSAPRYIDHQQDLPWMTPSGYNYERSQMLNKREALVGWRDSFGKLDAAVNLTWLRNSQHYKSDFLTSLGYNSNAFMGSAWSTYITTRKGISSDLAYRFNESGSLAHQVEFHAAYIDERLDADLSYFESGSDFLSQFHRKKRDFQLQDTVTIAPLGHLQITPLIRTEKLDGPVLGSIWNPLSHGDGDLGWKTTGSISIKKHFDSGWQVFGNHGSYVRYPNFYELYGNGFGLIRKFDIGGRVFVLYPETGRTTDIGFGWQGRMTEKIRANFRLTWFQRDTENPITLYSTPIAAAYINGGPAVHRGLELEGGIAFGRRADLQFAVTRQEGHFTGDYSYWGYPASSSTPELRYPGQTIKVPGIPEIIANARLNLHFLNNDLTAFVEANYLGRVYLSNGTWENPLTTVNLGGSWLVAKTGPAKGARLSFGVNDVFNQGPKQTMGGEAATHEYPYYMCRTPSGSLINLSTWSNFAHPDYNGCSEAQWWGGAPVTGMGPSYDGYQSISMRDSFSTKANVGYPREGRVYYVTLSWTF